MSTATEIAVDGLRKGDDDTTATATATTDAKMEDSSSSTQKRKAPSPPPSDMTTSSKRTRREDTEQGSSRRGSTVTRSPTAPRQISPAERRLSASMEEKKRGKRLFGGLMNTLSQTTTNSQQRRRQEIERRQQEKATQQRAADTKHRDVKLGKIREVRQREQIKFEEQVMKTRHSHLVATARYLRTETKPHIYYLPWDLTQRQEYLIKDQVQDAKDLVDQETREFKQRKEKRLRDLGIVPEEKDIPSGDEMVIEETAQPPPSSSLPAADQPGEQQQQQEQHKNTVGSKNDSDPNPLPQPDSTNDRAPAQEASNAGGSHAKEADKAGDVMVDEGEDTVIY
ncbi:hypothetical protein PG987_008898 [Apiospora arundinis]